MGTQRLVDWSADQDATSLGTMETKKTMVKVAIDGAVQEAEPEELLIVAINRSGGSVPHVCYHPQLGPVQTTRAWLK